MGRVFKVLLSRIFICVFFILIQLGAFLGLIWGIGQAFTSGYLILEMLSFCFAFYIIVSDQNPSYKLAWLALTIPFPVFCFSFYLFFGIRHSNIRNKKRIKLFTESCEKYLAPNYQVRQAIKDENLSFFKCCEYLSDYSLFPPYKNSFCEYLSPGEKKFPRLIEELKNAKKFIFIETFIIKEGYFWSEILKILEEKIKEGVEVRLIYDDFGCLFCLPDRYHKTLIKKGLKCKVFNPLVPFINLYMNHREHRKMVIIDNRVAIMGGTNFSDEYINKIHPFGVWKDSDLLVLGSPVWSFTVMFLQMWNLIKKEDDDWSRFNLSVENIDQNYNQTGQVERKNGFIQPFGDIPIDKENICENTYKNLINIAKKYVYIATPYLILDNDMEETIILAAKNGVDVRIICPKIPDKKNIYLVTKSFFPKLIKAGVKIYLYSPGFIHSKMIVVDDEIASIGTANFDYRSFYLSFENCALIYKNSVIDDIKSDFLDMFNISDQISLEEAHKLKIPTKIYQSLLKIFAPMM